MSAKCTRAPAPLLQLLLIASCLSALSYAYISKSYQYSSFRLPKRIKPHHYELLVKPDLVSFAFEGSVSIHFQVINDPACNSALTARKVFGCDRNEIILHADEKLLIQSASLALLANGTDKRTSAQVYEISRDTPNQFLIIRVGRKLQTGDRGQLSLSFRGNLRGAPHGFYLNEFAGPDKVEKFYASTMFEPAHARKAFPCFDEPQLKATFDLSLVHAAHLDALANMKRTHQEPLLEDEAQPSAGTSLVKTRFARTPVMSTYLVAFAVGEFERLADEATGGKLELAVNTPRGLIGKARFALDIAKRAYAALLDYFAIEQPLAKIDLLSVKYHFGGGAMENWGLSTFYEKLILADGPGATLENRAAGALAIVHELAHQWFGNLVTMKWWDDLWLNEGFATWLSCEKTNEIAPEYHLDVLYVQDSHIVGLEEDSSPKSHPIRQANLKTADEIQASFDKITYAKGSAVVKMLEAYLGEEQFKLALRDYLNKHKFQNTDANDLWTALGDRSGLPVDRLMRSWLDQAGFPLISVELSGDKLLVRQERFNQSHGDEASQRQRWMVPISVLLVGQSSPDGGDAAATARTINFVLEESMSHTEVSLPSGFNISQPNSWLKLNDAFEGFYRVQYSSELLANLERPVRSKSMTPINRINLLDDLVALHSIERLDSRQLDEVLDWFRDEDDPGVVFSLAKTIEQLHDLADVRDERHLLLTDQYERIGRFELRPTDGLLETRARGRLLFTLVYCNYEPAIKEALELFDALMSSGGSISSIIGDSVLLAPAKWGSDEQLARLKVLFDEMDDDREKRRLSKRLFKNVDEKRKAKVLGEKKDPEQQEVPM